MHGTEINRFMNQSIIMIIFITLGYRMRKCSTHIKRQFHSHDISNAHQRDTHPTVTASQYTITCEHLASWNRPLGMSERISSEGDRTTYAKTKMSAFANFEVGHLMKKIEKSAV